MSTETRSSKGGAATREEILTATERLLSVSPAQPPVSLRAIAREVGIAAPSIYEHFDDRAAILDAVIDRGFRRLLATCTAAAEAAGGPAEQITAISRAYLRFAREQPGQYRTLFERSPGNIASPPHPYSGGLDAFDLIVRLFRQLRVQQLHPRGDPLLDAQSLLLALHGAATLPPALPGFPWAAEDALVTNLVTRLID